MHIRILFASPDDASLGLLHSLHDSAMNLMCLNISTAEARTVDTLQQRVADYADDVILLEAATPALVQSILEQNPQLRVVVLLPENFRQYRQRVWDAGACNSIPKEHMEQEWFSSIMCVMHRAMERERRLIAQYEASAVTA
jgi:DNA-binding NarL/FixJ family response regulator